MITTIGNLGDFGLSGLFSGIGGLISSGINAVQSLKAQREANKGNMELAKYQNEANVNLWREQNAEAIKQWERNNDYNSPTSQLARYRDAGLNPMLIYGSGSSVAGNSSSPASIGQAPHQERATLNPAVMPDLELGKHLGSAANMYLQGKLAENQISIGAAQAENLKSQSALNALKGLRERALTEKEVLGNKITKETYDDIVYGRRAGNRKTDAEIHKLETSADLDESNISVNAARIDELQSRLGLNAAHAASLYQGIRESAERVAGMKLSRRFDELTFHDRQMALVEATSQAIIKTEQGYLDLDIKKVEHYFADKFGIKWGSSEMSSILQAGLSLFGDLDDRLIDSGFPVLIRKHHNRK